MSSSATRIATGACSIASPRRTLCTNGSETLTEGMYRAGLRSPSAPSSNTCAALLDEALMRRPGWAPDVLSLFLELAALPSPSGEERPVADRVLDYLRALGLEAEEDDAGERIGSTMGNVLCRAAPRRDGGVPIFFCAHLDTVPPEGPIEPAVGDDGIVRNAAGTILGADNKAAVAAMLEAV